MESFLENEIRVVSIKEEVLADNKNAADAMRDSLSEKGTLMANVMGSPGAGKTELILGLLDRLPSNVSRGVIEGDIASTVDSQKMMEKGVDVVQLRTGGACHIDIPMVEQALDGFDGEHDFVVIENVGNLVCPAEFDTGAHFSMMLLSVPEGWDKVLKYPLMFTVSDALVITKCDLLPFFEDFNLCSLREQAKALNPSIEIFEVSSKNGDGLNELTEWVVAHGIRGIA